MFNLESKESKFKFLYKKALKYQNTKFLNKSLYEYKKIVKKNFFYNKIHYNSTLLQKIIYLCYKNIGDIQTIQGNFSKGLNSFFKALYVQKIFKKEIDSFLIYRVACILLKQNNFTLARTFLQKSFEKNPSNLIILNKLVTLLFMLQDIDRLRELVCSKFEFKLKNLNLQKINHYLNKKLEPLTFFKKNQQKIFSKKKSIYKIKEKRNVSIKQETKSIYFYRRKITNYSLKKLYQNLINILIYKKSSERILSFLVLNLLKDDFLYNLLVTDFFFSKFFRFFKKSYKRKKNQMQEEDLNLKYKRERLFMNIKFIIFQTKKIELKKNSGLYLFDFQLEQMLACKGNIENTLKLKYGYQCKNVQQKYLLERYKDYLLFLELIIEDIDQPYIIESLLEKKNKILRFFFLTTKLIDNQLGKIKILIYSMELLINRIFIKTGKSFVLELINEKLLKIKQNILMNNLNFDTYWICRYHFILTKTLISFLQKILKTHMIINNFSICIRALIRIEKIKINLKDLFIIYYTYQMYLSHIKCLGKNKELLFNYNKFLIKRKIYEILENNGLIIENFKYLKRINQHYYENYVFLKYLKINVLLLNFKKDYFEVETINSIEEKFHYIFKCQAIFKRWYNNFNNYNKSKRLKKFKKIKSKIFNIIKYMIEKDEKKYLRNCLDFMRKIFKGKLFISKFHMQKINLSLSKNYESNSCYILIFYLNFLTFWRNLFYILKKNNNSYMLMNKNLFKNLKLILPREIFVKPISSKIWFFQACSYLFRKKKFLLEIFFLETIFLNKFHYKNCKKKKFEKKKIKSKFLQKKEYLSYVKKTEEINKISNIYEKKKINETKICSMMINKICNAIFPKKILKLLIINSYFKQAGFFFDQKRIIFFNKFKTLCFVDLCKLFFKDEYKKSIFFPELEKILLFQIFLKNISWAKKTFVWKHILLEKIEKNKSFIIVNKKYFFNYSNFRVKDMALEKIIHNFSSISENEISNKNKLKKNNASGKQLNRFFQFNLKIVKQVVIHLKKKKFSIINYILLPFTLIPQIIVYFKKNKTKKIGFIKLKSYDNVEKIMMYYWFRHYKELFKEYQIFKFQFFKFEKKKIKRKKAHLYQNPTLKIIQKIQKKSKNYWFFSFYYKNTQFSEIIKRFSIFRVRYLKTYQSEIWIEKHIIKFLKNILENTLCFIKKIEMKIQKSSKKINLIKKKRKKLNINYAFQLLKFKQLLNPKQLYGTQNLKSNSKEMKTKFQFKKRNQQRENYALEILIKINIFTKIKLIILFKLVKSEFLIHIYSSILLKHIFLLPFSITQTCSESSKTFFISTTHSLVHFFIFLLFNKFPNQSMTKRKFRYLCFYVNSNFSYILFKELKYNSIKSSIYFLKNYNLPTSNYYFLVLLKKKNCLKKFNFDFFDSNLNYLIYYFSFKTNKIFFCKTNVFKILKFKNNVYWPYRKSSYRNFKNNNIYHRYFQSFRLNQIEQLISFDFVLKERKKKKIFNKMIQEDIKKIYVYLKKSLWSFKISMIYGHTLINLKIKEKIIYISVHLLEQLRFLSCFHRSKNLLNQINFFLFNEVIKTVFKSFFLIKECMLSPKNKSETNFYFLQGQIYQKYNFNMEKSLKSYLQAWKVSRFQYINAFLKIQLVRIQTIYFYNSANKNHFFKIRTNFDITTKILDIKESLEAILEDSFENILLYILFTNTIYPIKKKRENYFETKFQNNFLQLIPSFKSNTIDCVILGKWKNYYSSPLYKRALIHRILIHVLCNFYINTKKYKKLCSFYDKIKTEYERLFLLTYFNQTLVQILSSIKFVDLNEFHQIIKTICIFTIDLFKYNQFHPHLFVLIYWIQQRYTFKKTLVLSNKIKITDFDETKKWLFSLDFLKIRNQFLRFFNVLKKKKIYPIVIECKFISIEDLWILL